MASVPTVPRWLGLAGLLPQLACLYAVWLGPSFWRWTALAAAWGYAALIFSFLGGLWWGLAASAKGDGRTTPALLWAATVTPSLIAFASYLPWVFGAAWPEPSLIVLGIAILASLLVDRALVRAALAPAWWMGLRVPLSLGLGLSTILIALG